jgi:hypothetical protein
MEEYRYIGKDGMPILARDLEDQRDAALAKLAMAVETLKNIAYESVDDEGIYAAKRALVEIEGEKNEC